MEMKLGMNWVTPTLAVSVSKVREDGKYYAGTILIKPKGSTMLDPVYSGYDITEEMVKRYV